MFLTPEIILQKTSMIAESSNCARSRDPGRKIQHSMPRKNAA
jgi:hypothetical protein